MFQNKDATGHVKRAGQQPDQKFEDYTQKFLGKNNRKID
jgi:hypothetical protein